MQHENARQAVAGIKQLPTLPSVLTQVLAVASDPDASALDLGKQVASDPSLSAAVLRLVNSAYYGFYRQVTSIPNAIVLLGFNEVRNVALAATCFRDLGGGNSDYDREQLWRHCIAAAVAGERIAKLSGTGADGAFVAGMLHDIGKVALEVLFGEAYQEVACLAQTQGVSVRETETRCFGIAHPECGALLAEHWEFPPDLVTSIRSHHEPEQASQQDGLTHIACLANVLTYRAGLGEASNGREPEVPEVSCRALGMGEADLDDVVAHLKEARDRVEALADVLLA